MVWEERFYAEPKDISAIRLTCKECQSSTAIPIGTREYVPESCAYCKTQWFDKASTDFQLVGWLLQGLSGLKQRKAGAACGIHLELPGHINMPEDSK
jgi:hypothetical protein